MCRVLCVTSRALCRESFLTRMERIFAAGPAAVILREKDLDEADYTALAREVLALAGDRVPVILHSHPGAALALGCRRLHLPLPLLRGLDPRQRSAFQVLGASCHSAEEAREAQALGCAYITAGHVFETGCKPGLAPRGLDFLREVTGAVSIPVWAIGGIAPENFAQVLDAGAAGGCVMSGLMTCPDPKALLARFEGTGSP